MASEQRDPSSFPDHIEEWLTDRTVKTGESRETVLARAVAFYRMLAEDQNDALETKLSSLETRISTLESETDSDRIDALEAELDDHVEDLRARIVDVVKEAQNRASENHSHEEFTWLSEIKADHDTINSRLDAQESTTDELHQLVDELETEITGLESTLESQAETVEEELGSVTDAIETVETLEADIAELDSKADRLAGVAVNLRDRLQQIESHISHQTALAELLETAARENINEARCRNCEKTVQLGMLVEPACPHCRSVFESVTPGSMLFKSAWLTLADRPALEAGGTTEAPFKKTDQSDKGHDTQ